LADSSGPSSSQRRELRIAEEFADRSMTSFGLWVMARLYILQGDSRRALEAAERSVHMAPTTADRTWAESTLGMAHTRANNAEEAVGILARQLPVYRAAHFIPSEQATAYLGEAYWRAGDYEKGRAVLEELLLIVEPLGMRLVAAHAHRILGEIAAKTDPARAASYFDRSIASLLQIKAEPELARAYAGYGRFHERQGRIAAARDYLTRGLEIFERLGILGEPEKVRRELAELPTE
jgi:tetratricopeptide (TPR) repeat protein